MKNKRNTWLRRAAAFVLCAALVLMTGIFPTRVQAKSLEDLKQEYNELEKEIEANKKKLESIKNQQTSNAEKMKLLSSQAEAISSQLDVINSQLSVLNADIADYDREIAALDKKIDEAQSKIDKLDEQIDATQEKISERLRATYMAGSSSWIEILLESDSISSLLLRIQLLASVTENDNKLISQLEKQTEELNAAKADFVPDDGVILPETELSFAEGETAFDLLQRVCRDNGISMESSWSPLYKTAYIEGIANLYEFDCGKLSGWMYSVNGVWPDYGCSGYTLHDGDTVVWSYTCDLGRDVGALQGEP